jgi:hypothetical protein
LRQYGEYHTVVAIFSVTSQHGDVVWSFFHGGNTDHLSVNHGAAAASPIAQNDQAQWHDGTNRQILGLGNGKSG